MLESQCVWTAVYRAQDGIRAFHRDNSLRWAFLYGAILVVPASPGSIARENHGCGLLNESQRFGEGSLYRRHESGLPFPLAYNPIQCRSSFRIRKSRSAKPS